MFEAQINEKGLQNEDKTLKMSTWLKEKMRKNQQEELLLSVSNTRNWP